MTDDEIIAVVQAHKEGKKIEWRFDAGRIQNATAYWEPLTESWNWGDFRDREYRVAPEPRKPREWWIELRCDGSFIQMFTHSAQLTRGGELVHVQEIIE